MGSPCDPHMFPIRSPYVQHKGKISKTTKSYVAHMLSNIWGNLWAMQQHMGNIWGNVVIFAFKLALLNIMGNILATYGEHTGNIWGTYGKHMGNIWGAHPKQHPTAVSPTFTHTGIPPLSSGSVFDKVTTNRCTTSSVYAQLKVGY